VRQVFKNNKESERMKTKCDDKKAEKIIPSKNYYTTIWTSKYKNVTSKHFLTILMSCHASQSLSPMFKIQIECFCNKKSSYRRQFATCTGKKHKFSKLTPTPNL
jgi:hypothetical protein